MELFQEFLNKPKYKVEATKGKSFEEFGVLLELRNPRARISRSEIKGTPYSCLGELCWYLSGSDELAPIQYYIPMYSESSDDDQTVHGAYGPRIFKMNGIINQFQNIEKLLSEKKSSRRAVMQLFDAEDLEVYHKDIPCTNTMQFVIRDEKLDMMVSMRSNDIYKGLPHDIFTFTMIQEILSLRLGVELGTYKHAVGSLHLYEDDIENASKFTQEGWSMDVSMPAIPKNNFENDLSTFLSIEKEIRTKGYKNLPKKINITKYWYDLILLLKAFYIYKNEKSIDELERIRGELDNDLYDIYLTKYINKLNNES